MWRETSLETFRRHQSNLRHDWHKRTISCCVQKEIQRHDNVDDLGKITVINQQLEMYEV
jgi:hypothetical protein